MTKCLRVKVAATRGFEGNEAPVVVEQLVRIGAWSGLAEALGRAGCSSFVVNPMLVRTGVRV